jgi:hypothetical protein
MSSLARPPSRRLVARLLDEPDLPAAVRRLEPNVFDRLVRHVGLEDAPELLALATPAQLSAVLDADLWQAVAPGGDEAFDAERFATWLEVLQELGDEAAADKLAEMPEDLLVYALCAQVWVLDEAALLQEMVFGDADRSAQALVDKALESSLHAELDEYLLVSRRGTGWDATLSVLLALADRHNDLLRRVLGRCHAASADTIDDAGGLFDVLTGEEVLAEDAAAAREERRARAGYVAPAAARAFLRLARGTAAGAAAASFARDAIASAYFRDLERTPRKAEGDDDAPDADATVPEARLTSLLAEAGVLEGEPLDRTRALVAAQEDAWEALRPGDLIAASPTTRLRQALQQLADRNPSAWAERTRELAFTANVLLAGASQDGEPLRPGQAAEAALAICALGLDFLQARAAATPSGAPDAVGLLFEAPADKLFRLGWRSLADGRRLPPGDPLAHLLERLAEASH